VFDPRVLRDQHTSSLSGKVLERADSTGAKLSNLSGFGSRELKVWSDKCVKAMLQHDEYIGSAPSGQASPLVHAQPGSASVVSLCGTLEEMETIDHMPLINCAKATWVRLQYQYLCFDQRARPAVDLFREPFTGVACWREASTIRKKVPGRVSAGSAGFIGNRLCGEVLCWLPNKHPSAVGKDVCFDACLNAR